MNTDPSTIQMSAGSQPNIAYASMGPTIGPAPAIDEKWWPKRMVGLAGT